MAQNDDLTPKPQAHPDFCFRVYPVTFQVGVLNLFRTSVNDDLVG